MCTLQGVGGETVDFHTLCANASWATYRDMVSSTGKTQHSSADLAPGCTDTGRCELCTTGSHVVYDNVDLPGPYAAVQIYAGDSITWKNSEMGTAGNTTIRECGVDEEPGRASNASNVLITHVTFHAFLPDERASNCGGGAMHLETWRLWDSIDGMTFLDNYFDDGDGSNSYRISSGQGGCSPSECPDNINMHFIGNYFGERCCGYAGLDISFPGQGGACRGWIFAYNFFHDSDAGLHNGCVTETGDAYVGNMGYHGGGCPISGVVANNLWIGSVGSCGGNGNAALPGSSDNWSPYKLNADGYHLTASSPSINAGENAYCTQWANNLDIGGAARIGVCDAGPDEYGN